MVLLGTFFDLFDGLFARLLKAESQFGLQFDSMADLITSGIVPGVVMYKLFLEIGIREIDFTIAVFQNDFTFSFAPLALVGFLISYRYRKWVFVEKKVYQWKNDEEDIRLLEAKYGDRFWENPPIEDQQLNIRYFFKPKEKEEL